MTLFLFFVNGGLAIANLGHTIYTPESAWITGACALFSAFASGGCLVSFLYGQVFSQ